MIDQTRSDSKQGLGAKMIPGPIGKINVEKVDGNHTKGDRAVSDFYSQQSTLEALAAICGSGKLSQDLEKLLISAHHHVEALQARLDVVTVKYCDLLLQITSGRKGHCGDHTVYAGVLFATKRIDADIAALKETGQ